MKRFSAMSGLTILIGSFIPALAIDFDVKIEPGHTFVHPDDGLTYYKGNTDLYLDIMMGNDDGLDWTGFSMNFRIYARINGIDTDDVPIVWIDAGNGGDLSGSLDRMNGWDDATYFGMYNEVVGFNWDGSLPDTMNHTTASMTGWPAGDPQLTRYRFHFSLPLIGIDPLTDIVEICIDQADRDDIYTWDWEIPVDFGGPYCFEFLAEMETPPIVVAPPVMTTSHSTPYELNCYIQHDDWLPLSNVCAIDENDNPIGTATIFNESYLNWVFDPPCSWINDGLDHYVFFYPESEAAGLYCPETLRSHALLVVTEGQPEILGDYESEVLGKIGETNDVTINLNQDAPDGETWSYEVNPMPSGEVTIIDGVLSFTPAEEDDGIDYIFTVRATDCTGNYDECDVIFWARSDYLCGDPDEDSQVNILDIVYLINALYKDGPGPGPLEISDVNNDGAINILDVVYIINYKYKDGPTLNCPQ